MMKNIFYFILFISSFANAQHVIKGTMNPKIETDWVILYKIEGTKQIFVSNTTIKTDSITLSGKKQAVGRFEFKLKPDAKPGAYRVNYRTEGAGFLDIFYNKENISFIFNPDYPEQTVSFSKSSENKLYQEYVETISKAQEKLDSIQIAALQNPKLDLKTRYINAFNKVNVVQNKYAELSKEKYIAPIIKASNQNNSAEILTSVEDYLFKVKNSFFNNLDFNKKTLINSSFLTDRIVSYIFYINYSDDSRTQQKLYKEAIDVVLYKINNQPYKRDIIEFLIVQFEAYKNLEIIDYLFENHYNKLPETLQSQKFKSEKIALFASEIGRIAPDFSWKENGKSFKLSTLNDAEKYVLVFWSTSCSHCMREIPELHSYLKNKKNIKVIAFALEDDAFVWENYSRTNLYGWHNVLGLNKWQNETAKTYQIFSTPSYFVLDKSKKIIAKPNEIDDVMEYFNQE
ncbi:AhpC/TSA family protein [Polaribacter sp. KT25b]|uniref:TlpA disulfide reductase family protein n=1 Tax=Polaribacter sp. KT25b TaxID=1855336 RepID=UPI0008794371|nr:TlpA disulfide reductase family protein [Polaribacter sp. KT25b]SDS56279.1 AhpC/TSA family protein [Polaribacter sp. KT25b]